MASSGKKKTTMAKLTRESKLRERRVEKKARKVARKLAAANPETTDETLTDTTDETGSETTDETRSQTTDASAVPEAAQPALEAVGRARIDA